MKNSNSVVQKAIAAQRRVVMCERQLEEARQRLYDAVHSAVESGITLSALGRELGMTRQNVQRLMRRARPNGQK